MIIRVKKLNEKAVIPKYASEFSAGCDLYACIEEDVVIEPHCRAKIGTGLAIWPERKDVAVLIYGRSGLGAKYGIAPANCVGVVDSDYRGEIIVALQNSSNEPFTVHPGDRIAQMVVTPVISAEFEECDEIEQTERGAGGFGSTGR